MPFYYPNDTTISPGETSNVKIESAQTSTTNDSIKITGEDSALSTSNPGTFVMPDGTKLTLTSDITIDLTGAHFGDGGLGNLTSIYRRVLIINDNGTLKIGVAKLGGRFTVLTTDTNATATSVTTPEGILCNSAIASATNTCFEIGFAECDFNDTGDVYTVNRLVQGRTADGLWQPWVTTPTGWSATPSVATSEWSQSGRNIDFKIDAVAATSNATFARYTLPASARIVEFGVAVDIVNGGTNGGIGSWFTTAASLVLNTSRTGNRTDTWTGSGSKRTCPLGTYDVGPAASFID